jgi:microcystin-dependent protein
MIDSAPGSTSASFNDSTDIAGAHTHSHTLAVQSTGIAGVPVNNLQPSIVLNFIIKL